MCECHSKKSTTKKVKAWAVMWNKSDLQAHTEDGAMALFQEHRLKDAKEFVRSHAQYQKVRMMYVPITITYSIPVPLPTKRKKV